MASKTQSRRIARKVRKPKTAKSDKPDAKSQSKLDAMIAALKASKGATLAQLVALTGWQPHSVRGAMSGALKKQRGLAIVSAKSGAVRVYRIESGK